VSVEGRPGDETLPRATVDRISASGRWACLKRVSVTDNVAVANAIGEVLDECGRLDVVVNAAGFDRRADYLQGTALDWAAVLDVHLNGHVNLLTHSMPALAQSGGGRFVGFTSGAGWRAGHGNAYGCAKRAICVLAWSLAAHVPEGVTFNMISPVADTRMTHAHALDPAAGLNPASFPPAGHIAPLAVHLSANESTGYNGQVLFTDGSEVARIGAPRLLEAAAFDGSPASFNAVVSGILAPAEANQRSAGGVAARRSAANGTRTSSASLDDRCAVVITSGWNGLAVSDVASLLAAQGLRTVLVDGALEGVSAADVFTVAEDRLQAVEAQTPLTRALVLAGPSKVTVSGQSVPWRQVVEPFGSLAARVLHQAAWIRVFAQRSQTLDGVRVVHGQADAKAADAAALQAIAQLTRGVAQREAGRISAYSLAIRGDQRSWRTAIQFAGHLVTNPDATSLAGAELVVGEAWLGVNAHPQPIMAATYDGPVVPEWLDDALLDRSGHESPGITDPATRPCHPT
jgi:NAD(P)-dependent dehydrogenase (short-subunit alcohol dehydrogenase family)